MDENDFLGLRGPDVLPLIDPKEKNALKTRKKIWTIYVQANTPYES